MFFKSKYQNNIENYYHNLNERTFHNNSGNIRNLLVQDHAQGHGYMERVDRYSVSSDLLAKSEGGYYSSSPAFRKAKVPTVNVDVNSIIKASISNVNKHNLMTPQIVKVKMVSFFLRFFGLICFFMGGILIFFREICLRHLKRLVKR